MTQPASKRLITEATLEAEVAEKLGTSGQLDLALQAVGGGLDTAGADLLANPSSEMHAAVAGIAGTGNARTLTRTAVKTGNYTAALWDLVPCNTSGGSFTLTLPAASSGKGRIAGKLITAGNTLNLALTGSDHFNSSSGPTTGTLTLTNQGFIAESDGVSIWTITADDLPLSQLDGRYLQPSQVAPLAQPGQTPSQAPVPDTSAGSVGSQAFVARSDHSHPLAVNPFGGPFLGPPPAYAQDYVVDGTNTGSGSNIYRNGVFGNFGGIWSYAGSVATIIGGGPNVLICRNFTLNAGITLQGATPGMGLVIVASGTVTINGTLKADGESPAAGAALTQTFVSAQDWRGYGGSNGGTGNGATAPTPTNPTDHPTFLGGPGGVGGTSGSNTAGNPTPNYSAGTAPWSNYSAAAWGPISSMFLAAPGWAINQYRSIYTHSAGAAGGAGAGDGTNKGGSPGCGAGMILIVCKKLVIGSTAVFSAKGGNGAPGAGGNAAGGGGGGGGLVALNCFSVSLDPAAQFRTSGGTGGAGVGTGTTGANGGQSPIVDPPVANGGFNLGAGVMLNVWQ
jgi:hypothetical protein